MCFWATLRKMYGSIQVVVAVGSLRGLIIDLSRSKVHGKKCTQSVFKSDDTLYLFSSLGNSLGATTTAAIVIAI